MAANLLTSYLMDRVTDLVACQMSLKESILTGRFFSLLKRFFLLSLRSAQCPAVAALNTAIFFPTNLGCPSVSTRFLGFHCQMFLRLDV